VLSSNPARNLAYYSYARRRTAIEESSLNRIPLLIVALVIALAALPATHSQSAPIASPDAVPGEFVVKFRADATPAQRLAAVRSLGGESFDRVERLQIEAVRFRPGRDGAVVQAAAVIDALERHPLIEYAEPNYILSIADTATEDGPYTYWFPLILESAPPLPNDPLITEQYGLSRIKAFEGWAITRGSPAVVIAVIDSGVQLSHPDLDSKLVAGYDVIRSSATPEDGNGHGTHVAGIAAAITDNGIGISGTCPECRVLPIRSLNDAGSGTLLDVVTGINWAASRGAQVINLSLTTTIHIETLRAALDDAWSRGAFVACAAGNRGSDIYPGVYANCFAVAATDQHDTIGSFSNRGTWVEVAAPGVSVYSTWIGSGYRTISGTSMAAPHVAGVAGLLAGQGLSNAQIRDRLCATADPIAGTGSDWQCGRLNLLRAVRGF
jgi:thermitase